MEAFAESLISRSSNETPSDYGDYPFHKYREGLEHNGFLPIRKLLTLLSEQGRLSRLLNVADF